MSSYCNKSDQTRQNVTIRKDLLEELTLKDPTLYGYLKFYLVKCRSCLQVLEGQFDIELQINDIGIGWFLLPLPPKNRTCEFPRIRLKWLRYEDARLATPIRESLGGSRIRREERILRAS